MTSPKPPARLTGRTRIITAVSIGAVGLAGLFAIGANLGILTSADQSDLGTMSAAGDLVPVDSQVVDVYLDEQGDPVGVGSTEPTGSQRFTVDTAGTVDVTAGPDGLRIDRIDTAAGWTATPATPTGGAVAATFTNGTRTLHFAATLAADGTIAADVTEPTDAPSADPPAAGTAPAGGAVRDDSDDSYEDEDEDEDDEYEGRDSDD